MTKSTGVGRGKGGGRPTVVTPSVVALLRAAFGMDLSVEEACREAEISTDAYYDERKRNPKFTDEMDKAQKMPIVLAKKTIIKSIQRGNSTDARWLLERRQPERYGRRDGEAIPNPTPMTIILPGRHPHPRITLPEPNEVIDGVRYA